MDARRLYKSSSCMWKVSLWNPAAGERKPCPRPPLHILSRGIYKPDELMHIPLRSLYKEILREAARRIFLYSPLVLLCQKIILYLDDRTRGNVEDKV